MASRPTSEVIIFMALVLAAGGLAAAGTNVADDLAGAKSGQTDREVTAIDADISILNSETFPGYDDSADQLVLSIKNIGRGTLPADAGAIDVTVNGEYVPSEEMSVSVIEDDAWYSGSVARVEIQRSLPDAVHEISVDINTATAQFSFSTTPRPEPSVDEPRIAFVTNPSNGEGQLATIDGNRGQITTHGIPADQVETVGAVREDLDGDGDVDIPYTSPNPEVEGYALKFIGLDDDQPKTIVESGASKGSIAVGDYDGTSDASTLTGVGVYYADQTNQLYERTWDATSSAAIDEPYETGGVSGIADFSGEFSGDELVYVGQTSNDNKPLFVRGGENSLGSQAGNRKATGPPADYDNSDDNGERVPIVTSTNSLILVDENGNTVQQVNDAAATGVTHFDTDGDGIQELVYVSTGGRLSYYDVIDGTGGDIEDSSGGVISASQDAGAG